MTRQLLPEEDKKIIELRKNEATVKAIAAEVHISPEVIARRLRELGYPVSPNFRVKRFCIGCRKELPIITTVSICEVCQNKRIAKIGIRW